MVYPHKVILNAASKDINIGSDQVHIITIGKIYHYGLLFAVIGQYDDALDGSQFVIILYFPLLGYAIFPCELVHKFTGSLGFLCAFWFPY